METLGRGTWAHTFATLWWILDDVVEAFYEWHTQGFLSEDSITWKKGQVSYVSQKKTTSISNERFILNPFNEDYAIIKNYQGTWERVKSFVPNWGGSRMSSRFELFIEKSIIIFVFKM